LAGVPITARRQRCNAYIKNSLCSLERPETSIFGISGRLSAVKLQLGARVGLCEIILRGGAQTEKYNSSASAIENLVAQLGSSDRRTDIGRTSVFFAESTGHQLA
jgi:outer membrane murein-binding lipoprotein Lpp